jgi:hypothetical protein
MQQINNVHVKVEYNQEYRRFVVETLSFANLDNTLRALLNITPTQPIKILFLDDEKDWVLVSSDEELTYAVELSASLLRLSVRPETVLKNFRLSSVINVSVADATPAEAPFCGRGRGGMRGRGCRAGKVGCKADPTMRMQFLDNKLARLTERHAALSAKLPGMPEDKARALTWRLSHMEKKIETIKAKKAMFAAILAEQPPLEQESCVAVEEPKVHEPEVTGWGCRGRRGGRCGGGRKWMCEGAEADPLFQALQTKKAELMAARQGGNKEEIQAKWEALQEAKVAWRENKRSLMAARRQAK